MKPLSKTVLLMGTAALALAACSSTKGPGAIGTKNDIVVRNHGMPGQADVKAPPPGADIPDAGMDAANAALAMPPAEVEQGEPLFTPEPDVESAAQEIQQSTSPVTSTVAETFEESDSATAPLPPLEGRMSRAVPDSVAPQSFNETAPVIENVPAPVEEIVEESAAEEIIWSDPAPTPAPVLDEMPEPAPVFEPVSASAPVTSVSPAQSSIYPVEDYPAGTAPYIPPKGKSGNVANDLNRAQLDAIEGNIPSAVAQPVEPTPQASSDNAYVPVPAGTPYPLDPNAPYSPSAMSGRTSAAVVETPSAPPAVPPSAAVTVPASVPAAAVPVVPTKAPSLIDPVVIRSAQMALRDKAGYTGPITGEVDAMFLNALTVYQQQNGLPLGGVNASTFRHLGVIE